MKENKLQKCISNYFKCHGKFISTMKLHKIAKNDKNLSQKQDFLEKTLQFLIKPTFGRVKWGFFKWVKPVKTGWVKLGWVLSKQPCISEQIENS